jgi:hypothetical protein
MNNCQQGKHNFILIEAIELSPFEAKMIRWCEQCGAIVVDLDCDRRTLPGYFSKLKGPKHASSQTT